MRKRILVFAALASTLAYGQTPSPTSLASSSLDLLNRVAQRYKEAKSYYIESVEERTSTSEYRRDWVKTFLVAAESPENHYRYEGRSGFSNALQVSDGATIWIYHGNEHRYTAKPQSSDNADAKHFMPTAEFSLAEAQNLRKTLTALSKSFKSADLLHDASFKRNGHKIPCYVVRVRSTDQKRPLPNYSFEKTIWIDKNQMQILRIAEHARIQNAGGNPGIIIEKNSITTFSNTILDGPVPDNLFHFVPPAEALLIDDFPDPLKSSGETSLLGEQAPSLKFKSANGQIVPLDSYRGKPVLIDFWATWCAPCREILPKLDKIYHEAGDKGLALISVDFDEEAQTASDLLAQKNYSWPNFHDEGEIEKAIGPSGIPREMLIDAQGKVVYDGPDEDDLRAAISKLGTEYSSLAPKKQPACPATE
jgi:thiol-disulfide isomerase/thioredoxin